MSELTDPDAVAEQLPSESMTRRRSSRGRARVFIGLGFGILVVALVSSNVFLWTSLKSTQTDLTNTRRTVARVQAGAGHELRGVSDRVDTLESQVGDTSSGNDDVASRVDDAESGLSDLEDCVNAFLRGFDTANGGFFRYQFC